MKPDSNAPVYFACNLCGECCSSWNIPIERAKAESLLQKPWVQTRLSETRRELVAIDADFYRLPLTDENSCVFLGADRRCQIEVNEGAELKPAECKRFPFAQARLPDGTTRHDTSAACKTIAEKLLLAFEPIQPRPGDSSLTETREMKDFPRKIHTGLFKILDWQDYQAYQQQLRAIFIQEGIPPEKALRKAYTLLKRQNNCFSKKDRSSEFSPIVYRLIPVLFLRKPYGTFSWFQLFGGKRYEDPRLFGLPLDLKAQGRLPWNPAYDHHLNAFLFNLLQRSLPVARGQSLEGMLAMAGVACILIQWYARSLSTLREEEPTHHQQVCLDDVTVAIRLVERYYTGHQPRFLHFFHSRLRGKLLAKLLFG